MIDNAMQKQAHTKGLLPPSKRFPRWMEKSGKDLIYLGWGERRFELEPVPLHSNGGWVYWIITEGRVLVEFENEKKAFEPGEGILAGPDLAFGFPHAGQSRSRILTWIWKSEPPYFPVCKADAYTALTFGASEVVLLSLLHRQCRYECLHADSRSEALIGHYRSVVDVLFTRAVDQSHHLDPSETRLQTARQWMLDNLDAKRPVEDLARYLNLGTATVHRLFKDTLGESPSQHLRRLKMERARELLNRKQLSVKHIAFELGYQYANDFSRAFNSYWGHPPSAVARSSRPG